MSKEEFVTELMKNKDILEIKSTEQASMIFDYFIHILKNKLQHLEEGEYFRLHKIGSFYPLYLKSRTVRNPRTGERVTTPPSKKIRFKSYISSSST
ncbi:MAG: HU family DNA-binding protein [Wolbachia sp.]